MKSGIHFTTYCKLSSFLHTCGMLGMLAFAFNFCSAQDSTQQIVAGRFNSARQQAKPYVILISVDGLRYDMAEKYNAVNLLRLRNAGVEAAYMRPSFPSLTFPNHYTIVTGLYPAHHGLADNNFFDEKRKILYSMDDKTQVADSSWYAGTPLWVLAEKQQMLSACFYWVASEAAIQGIRPTYSYIYNDKIDIDTRINIVKNWLQLPANKRPHLITFYFPQVDHEAHTYGPDSKQAADAVHFIDESIGKMVSAVDSLHLPVNFVLVSDHGMTAVDNANPMALPPAVDTSKFIIPWGDALVQLHAKNKKDILPVYYALKKQAIGFDVYLTNNTPAAWHYKKKDDRYNRIGDILLEPIPPKIFNLKLKPVSPGKHGYDPAITNMHACFYAWGPAFKQHVKIAGFENVHVYPLIANILGLKYTQPIDGKLQVLKGILK